MSSAFADTSFYVASLNPKDTWHRLATTAGSNWRGTIVTTDYVIVELGNRLCGPSNRRFFSRFVRALQKDEKTHILPASPELLQAGLTLFSQRDDKSWSLTDCISFAVMEARGMTDAFSCDHHFEQAGFRMLLNL